MVNKTSLFLTVTLLLLLPLTMSMPVTDGGGGNDSDDGGDFMKAYDPANVIRQSARNRGETEMVDASDVQKLRDRANANVSHTLSNTSLADLESDNLTQLLQSRYRERKRQERLLVIQTQILQRLRMNRQPNISANVFSEEEQRRINAIVRRVHQFNNHNSVGEGDDSSTNSTQDHRTAFEQQFGDDSAATPRAFRFHTSVQKVQSFYPSCSLPNNTDKNLWEHRNTLRIYYELPLSRYSSGPEVVVILAKLRLYKVSPTRHDVSESDLAYLSRYNLIDTLIHHSPTNIINVHIYQYVKPLRSSRKERKRLVDTRSLPVEYEGWIEFNVVTSINYWLRHNNKNFGFDVEVEDAFGNKLNPTLFFRNMNCSSKESIPQDPPFPNIIEINREMMGENDSSSLFDNETYPTLDLQTADVTSFDSASFHLYQSSPFANGEEASKRVMRKRHLHHHHQLPNHFSRADLEPRKEAPCNKETIQVSVTDLKLDNVIIYPKEFEWTFCSGSCFHDSEDVPKSYGQSSQPSALNKLGNLLRSVLKHIKMSTDSQCVASGYKSLPIIYSSSGANDELEGIILKDLVPTECSCKS